MRAVKSTRLVDFGVTQCIARHTLSVGRKTANCTRADSGGSNMLYGPQEQEEEEEENAKRCAFPVQH